MLLEIENIGLIGKAALRLDGLTVIGGENDTGKSTAGKLMFAITKALSRYNEDFALSKEAIIRDLAQKLYLSLRLVSANLARKERDEFSLNQFELALLNYKTEKQFDIEYFFQSRFKILNTVNDNVLKPRFIQQLEEIKSAFLQEEDRDSLIEKALHKALVSEFYFEISPNDKFSFIRASDNNIPLLDIKIKNNKIEKVKIGDIFNFEDVTFIETPLVLQLSELVRYSTTLFDVTSDDKSVRFGTLDKPTSPLHFKDLVSKLRISTAIMKDDEYGSINTRGLDTKISHTIDGEFQYDNENRDFIFRRKEEQKTIEIKSLNTASGIKSFGIIQLLLQAGFIDEGSLLIIDEPETHLHPKWQIEYAKLIVELVKNNFPVLLTSHSPYMIQALRVLSEKEEISDRTAFYLAERNEQGASVFEDVSKDLKKLFNKLAEPLNQLIW